MAAPCNGGLALAVAHVPTNRASSLPLKRSVFSLGHAQSNHVSRSTGPELGGFSRIRVSCRAGRYGSGNERRRATDPQTPYRENKTHPLSVEPANRGSAVPEGGRPRSVVSPKEVLGSPRPMRPLHQQNHQHQQQQPQQHQQQQQQYQQHYQPPRRVEPNSAVKPGVPETVSNAAGGSENASPAKDSAVHKRRQLITLGAVAAAVLCPCGLLAENPSGLLAAAPAPRVAAAPGPTSAGWGYGQLSGPLGWGSSCQAGTQQSPIDIPAEPSVMSAHGDLRFLYKAESPSFYNTGHGTMQVDFPRAQNHLFVDGRPLQLLQYHFHAPSEHSVDGQRAAMEAHLVHRDPDGGLAVIGVMLESAPDAKRNSCLQAALEFAPVEHGKRRSSPASCFFAMDPSAQVCPTLKVDPRCLIPEPDDMGRVAYMNYTGSLTTPPCSEGVRWFVLAKPLEVPSDQILEFMKYLGDGRSLFMNARPIQPLNNRIVARGPV
eukprot:TRINITY_DN186_c7_g1_i1.p1 TRINITY_DN186_c7_g1~~TRINITY_DN186_c7_g1_i1.p1  ORF type:complete len:488 (-),score=41.08 TRINITY_DN186_c7_g1_i1:760-2223(-)